MANITLNIEVESAEELQETLTKLQGLSVVATVEKEVAPTGKKKQVKSTTKGKSGKTEEASTGSTSEKEISTTGEKEEIKQEKATKTRYFLHKPTNKTFVVKKGEGIPVEAIHYGDAVEMTKAEYDKFNKRGESDALDTQGKYPNATKEDVTELVKKLISEKKRDAIRTALDRHGVEKVPELNPKNYGAFMTDLEELAGE